MNRNPAVTALVRRLFLESFTELLVAYNLTDRIHEDTAEPPREHRVSYVSVLTLTADGLRISSTLDLDIELLARLHPMRADTREAPITVADLEDWCAELNNQLGGRLKNKLLVRGCHLATGLPSLLTGIDISSIAQDDDMDTYQAAYVSEGRRMVVTLATDIAADTRLTEPTPAAANAVLREGAVVLF